MKVFRVCGCELPNYQVKYNKSNNVMSLPDLKSDTVSFSGRKTLVKISNAEIRKMKNDLKQSVKENDVYKIMDYLGYEPKADKKGFISVSHYWQPGMDFDTDTAYLTFSKLGINENKLFEKIKEIRGDAYFYETNADNLGVLETIGHNADFKVSEIKNLGNLKMIGGNADFRFSNVKDLGNLKSVRGDVDLSGYNLSAEDFENIDVAGKIYKLK